MSIYVPSRRRPETVDRTLPTVMRVAEGQLKVHVVVEPEDVGDYAPIAARHGAELLVLNDSNRGVSFARNSIVRHAAANGDDVCTMIDDDHRFHGKSAPVWFMEEVVKRYRVAGCGAYRRIWLHLQDIPEDSGVVPLGNTLGLQVFALDVDKCLDVGGFDENLHEYDDSEMLCRLVKAGHGPWAGHTSVLVNSVVPLRSERRDPTGQLIANRGEQESLMAKMVHEKHPDCTYFVKGRIRFKWQQLYKQAGQWPLALVER